MSAKEPRRRSDRRGSAHSSVVGSKVRDVSTRLQGRGLPRGGIREQDGLKVSEGALPDSTIVGSVRNGDTTQRVLRIVAVVSGILVILFVAIAIALAILSSTSALTVTSIETADSEHVTADELARLANVGEGVTLLNVDAEAIEQGVKKNPWVESVKVERVFPDTLRLSVTERSLGAVVAMSSGGVAWLLGADNVWIEPYKFEVSETESVNDAALAQASELGVILIANVPPSVNPVAGAECNDAAIQSVMQVANQLSEDFKKQVVCYSASSEDDISCILTNGVEISLGSNSNIDTKEAVARQILDEFSGQITYINVRIPSRPTYRRVDSEYVREGTGATGSAVDTESILPKDSSATDDASKKDSSNDSSSSESESEDVTGDSESTGTEEDTSGYSDYTSDYTSDYAGYTEDSTDYGESYDESYGYADESQNTYDTSASYGY